MNMYKNGKSTLALPCLALISFRCLTVANECKVGLLTCSLTISS